MSPKLSWREILSIDAVDIMKMLKISPEYIKNFKENGLTQYVRAGYVYPLTDDIKKIVSKIEFNNRVLIYYVIVNRIKILSTGNVKTLYTMLCVEDDMRDSDETILITKGLVTAFDYTVENEELEFVCATVSADNKGILNRHFIPSLVVKQF